MSRARAPETRRHCDAEMKLFMSKPASIKKETVEPVYPHRGEACVSLLLLLFAFCLPVKTSHSNAQQSSSVTSSSANQVAQTELSAAARVSLDAAVEALQRGALSDAERSARAAVLAAPRSPIPHNVLGVVLDRMGRADAAFAEFNAA